MASGRKLHYAWVVAGVTFLTLLNPVTAALLGWVILDQRLNAWQILGALLILVSVVLGQPGTLDRLRRRPLASVR